jgi:membrane-associated HD superfamily phosphohydrolase
LQKYLRAHQVQTWWLSRFVHQWLAQVLYLRCILSRQRKQVQLLRGKIAEQTKGKKAEDKPEKETSGEAEDRICRKPASGVNGSPAIL